MRELTLLEELVERGDELALSQVTRATEDHEDETLGLGMLCGRLHSHFRLRHCTSWRRYHSLYLSNSRGRIHP